MNQINTNNGIQEFSEEADLITFNKALIDAGSDLLYFKFTIYGRVVEVSLTLREISIDGEEVDLGLSEQQKTSMQNLKWINFRRVFRHFHMGEISDKILETKYGIGFQGQVDGENIQRFLLFNEDAQYELQTKK
jgi:hypothetical protein